MDIIILILTAIYIYSLWKLCIPIDESSSKKYKRMCFAYYILGLVVYIIGAIISSLTIG